MTRCLSDETLTRVVAELGTEAELAHLATCAACAARHRRVTGEVDMIRQVLVSTTEPRRRAVPSRWRSVAAVAALSAVAVGALVWIEVAAWKTIQPTTDLAQEQMSAALTDVTAALFSVDGEPRLALAESPVAALEQDGDAEARCDESTGLDETDCSATLSGLENPGLESPGLMEPGLQDPMDPIEVEAPERTVLEIDNADQGG